MTDVQQLLAEYAQNGSETAFRELVARYLNFVYSTALRLVGGHTQLAEDVAQLVFIDLARKARTFPPGVMLGGWLHQHTFYMATKAARTELRRQNRESESVRRSALDSGNDWPQLAPLLDEAITQLDAGDRAAILLRFFEQRDFRAIGSALGGSEDAARMRVNRALEKLQVILKRQGVALSAVALGAALADGTVTAAPVGLAAGIATAAIASIPAGGTLATTIGLIMTKLHVGIISVLAVAAVTLPLAIQHRSRVQLREKDDALRQQTDQIARWTAQTRDLSNQIARVKGSQELSKAQLDDLLRLRSQIGDLKKQLANVQTQAISRTDRTSPPPDPLAEERRRTVLKQQAIARIHYAKDWMLGFFIYAGEHQDKFPTSFDQVIPILKNDPNGDKAETILSTNQFEIVFQGSRSAITNASEIIVVREIEAQPAENGWTKAYGFADGHSEIHRSEDGNFNDWESQRIIATPNQ